MTQPISFKPERTLHRTSLNVNNTGRILNIAPFFAIVQAFGFHCVVNTAKANEIRVFFSDSERQANKVN